MNPIIRNRLPAEYQMLWELTRKKRLSGDLASTIQTQIRQVRKNFRNTKKDVLTEKFLNFGNEGMWSTNKIRELSKFVYENKKPSTLNVGEWISVEIECVMPSEEAETEFIKFVRRHKFTDCITLKNDGSIRTISPQRLQRDERRRAEEAPLLMRTAQQANRGNDDMTQEQRQTRTAFGREIVMTFRYNDWKFVNLVCGELRRLKCFVNQSCGLHVHFDCRHLNGADVTRIGKRIAVTIPALKQILPPSRQTNRFCALNINDIDGGENRYSFVNLQSYHRHQTIEIRGHSGTIDPVKIVNWIRILKKIMDKRSRKDVETIAELIGDFKLEADLAEYVNARYNKFHQEIIQPAERQHLDDVEIDESEPGVAPDEVMNAQPAPMQTEVPAQNTRATYAQEGAITYTARMPLLDDALTDRVNEIARHVERLVATGDMHFTMGDTETGVVGATLPVEMTVEQAQAVAEAAVVELAEYADNTDEEPQRLFDVPNEDEDDN